MAFALRPNEVPLASAPAILLCGLGRSDGDLYLTSQRLSFEGVAPKDWETNKMILKALQIDVLNAPRATNGKILLRQVEGELSDLTSIEQLTSAGAKQPDVMQLFWRTAAPTVFRLTDALPKFARLFQTCWGKTITNGEVRADVSLLKPDKVEWQTLPDEMRLTLWNYNDDSGSGGHKSRPYLFRWATDQKLFYLYWSHPPQPMFIRTVPTAAEAERVAALWLAEWLTDCGVSYA